MLKRIFQQKAATEKKVPRILKKAVQNSKSRGHQYGIYITEEALPFARILIKFDNVNRMPPS